MNLTSPAPIAISADVIPRGDGTFILKPRKPVEWVRTSEAARQCSVSEKTIIRWIQAKRIDGRRVGPRIWQVSAVSLQQIAA